MNQKQNSVNHKIGYMYLKFNEISLNFRYIHPILWFALFCFWFTLYSLLSYISCDLKMAKCKCRNMSSA